MEAFLLAAGLGTRLRPLTNDRPKALVEVSGKTLLEINLSNLIRQGATRVVVNVHHFGEQVIEFIRGRAWGAEVVISDEREQLLDTGGGLKRAGSLLSGTEPVLIHNVDILSRLDLGELVGQQKRTGAMATLAVSRRDTSRMLIFDEEGKLVGWHNRKDEKYIWSDEHHKGGEEMAFSGIAVVDPRLIELLPEADGPYPIVPAYLEISREHRIESYVHDSAHWLDVGKPETLAKAHEYLPE